MSSTAIGSLGGPSGFVPLPFRLSNPATEQAVSSPGAPPGDQLTLSPAGQQAVGQQATGQGGGLLGAGLGALGRLQSGLLSFLGQGFAVAPGDVVDSLEKSLLQPVHDAIGALADEAQQGGTQAVAGHATLSVQGISITIHQSKDGIDVSFDEVSVNAESDVAAVSKGGAFAAFAGFAAEVSTLHVSLHIGAAGQATGAAPGAPEAVQPAGNPQQPLLLTLLPPGDPRRSDADGQPRSDAGFLPDLSGLTGGLQHLVQVLRAVAADATGAAGGAQNGALPAAPTLLVLRDQKQDDAGNTHLLLDAHTPLAGASGGTAATGGGLDIQA